MPDLKTPLLWLLCLGLAAALVGIGAGQLELAKVRAELADVKAVHLREEAARATAALNDAVAVGEARATHATVQQEIVHVLTKPDPALAAALSDNRALAGRLRIVSDQLAAARDRPEGEADPASCRSEGDPSRALLGLLEEAGRLLSEGIELDGEGRSLVVRRDAEVRALKALLAADRALMEPGGTGLTELPISLDGAPRIGDEVR